MNPRLFGLALAGGCGRRLAAVTGGIPKQFWRVAGRVSLLESTVRRLAPLVPERRLVTVVDASHRPFIRASATTAFGRVVYQPADRGTATGLLLGLLAIPPASRGSLVVITPADHGIRRPDLYRRGLALAMTSVDRHETRIVLFGAEPTSAAGDLGWILPARGRECDAHRQSIVPVAGFVEKPGSIVAEALHVAGAVWNTMVMVSHVGSLLDALRAHVPVTFGALSAAVEAERAGAAGSIEAVYDALPHADLSSDVVSRLGSLDLYVWPASLDWSDLGTPERLLAWRAAHTRRVAAGHQPVARPA